MGKTNNKTKPDLESIHLTYDELEVALIALSIRQEELRDLRSQDHNKELETLWYVCDKMDYAQRNLEDKMTRQVSDWLRSIDKDSKHFTRKTKGQSNKPGKAKAKAKSNQKPGLLWRLSRITRL